jgi:membrane-bound lytic murein transglycosylase A
VVAILKRILGLKHLASSGARAFAATALALALAACQTAAPPKPAPPAAQAPAPGAPVQPEPAPAQPVPGKPVPPPPAQLRAVGWDALPGWRQDDVLQAWDAFLRGCSALAARDLWQRVCADGTELKPASADAVRGFFEARFTPWQIADAAGIEPGLVTGYYEPLLFGSRTRSQRYRYPVYGVPDDLLIVDLGDVYPELKGYRLRGRLDGKRVVPYYNRAQIDQGDAPLATKVLAWVEDPVELFFLQIQGSGRIRLESGETMMVGYADQNGHPYRSIGRVLIDRGDLPLEQTSMQGIKAWARKNPDQLQALLNNNASYVFFRELPPGLPGPIGALGVPLTARRSIAVDARFVPLGAPVFLATTFPNTKQPLNRLMLAQDTGGAIRGAVRADFFWGFGEEAAREAGRMKQQGRMWLLYPADAKPPGAIE